MPVTIMIYHCINYFKLLKNLNVLVDGPGVFSHQSTRLYLLSERLVACIISNSVSIVRLSKAEVTVLSR
jgi:hypothetical protein